MSPMKPPIHPGRKRKPASRKSFTEVMSRKSGSQYAESPRNRIRMSER